MKRKLKRLVTLVLGITLMVGFNSCGKESSGGIEPTPVNPTPNNGGGGNDKPTPEPDNKPTPISDGKVKVFEQVVKVEDSQVTDLVCDTINNHFSVTFSGSVPDDVKPGKVLVVNNDMETTVILVTGVERSGSTAELAGILGDMSYVFYDTEFAIAGDPSLVDNKDIPVFTPQSEGKSLSKAEPIPIDEVDPDATFKIERTIDDLKISGGASAGFKMVCEDTENGWSWGWNSTVTPSINFTKDKVFTIGTEIPITIHGSFVYWNRFGKPVCERLADYDFYKAEWVEEQFYLDGEFSFSPSVTATAKAKIIDEKCKNVHLGQMWGQGYIIPDVGRVYFALDLFGDVAFKLNAEAEVHIETTVGLHGRIGFAKLSDDTYDFINSLDIVKKDPVISASVQCNGRLDFAVYPIFSAAWLTKKGLGLGVGLKPATSFDIGIGAGWESGKDGDKYFAASASFSVTPKVCLGAVHEKILKEETEFYPVPISIGKKGISTTYEFAPIKDKKIKGTDKYSADGDFIELFPKMFEIKCPGALHITSISDGNTEYKYGIKDVNFKDMDKNFVQFPVRAGVPITIHLHTYSMMKWNIPFYKGEDLIDFAFPPNTIVLEFGNSNRKNEYVFCGLYPTYEWIPESDIETLEASVYDYEGEKKGSVTIGRKKFFKDIKNSYPSSDNVVILRTIEKCNLTLFIDGDEIKTVKNSYELRCDLSNYVGDGHSFHVVAETMDGTEDITFAPNIILSNPLKMICDPVTKATNGETAIVKVTTYKDCMITLYVDGVQKANTPRGRSLFYDVSQLPARTTPYRIKVEAEASIVDRSELEFECTIAAAFSPVTIPISPVTTLPSVSGSTLDGNKTNGTAPNVSGQNVDQQYNGGGKSPNISGQYLDQTYNGGGDAPNVKGTNL